jgi:thiamine-phosphate diphosphorylase
MLLAITDRRAMGDDPIGRIRALAEALGSSLIVQIREKDLDAGGLFEWVRALLPAIEANASALFVNGRADVVRCFAPRVGLHLPEDGLPLPDARRLMPPGTQIGVSVHDRRGLEDKLATGGADLAAIAPVFETPSKPGVRPLGLDGLSRAIAGLDADQRRRVFALGGIDRSNADAVLATGVGGWAAIRAAWEWKRA